jgi:hypothetical protein
MMPCIAVVETKQVKGFHPKTPKTKRKRKIYKNEAYKTRKGLIDGT